jgi:hypothetical protein
MKVISKSLPYPFDDSKFDEKKKIIPTCTM